MRPLADAVRAARSRARILARRAALDRARAIEPFVQRLERDGSRISVLLALLLARRGGAWLRRITTDKERREIIAAIRALRWRSKAEYEARLAYIAIMQGED